MTTDSFFAVMCGGMIALLFGLALCFAGYRLFLVLLPIWAFVFGFGLGAQTVQVIFGDAFLATVIGMDFGLIVWLIGLVAAVALAVVVLRFNVQKIVIEVATAFLGAGAI